jgi:hypothetical protein
MGEDNTAADGLSQLPMAGKTLPKFAESIFTISNLDRESNSNLPLNMGQICKVQQKDKAVQQCISSGKFKDQVATTSIDGRNVTTFDGKVWVRKELQQWIVEWYHTYLQLAGMTRMINTIGHTFA